MSGTVFYSLDIYGFVLFVTILGENKEPSNDDESIEPSPINSQANHANKSSIDRLTAVR
jgi:hypothetical protein